jgi:transposase
MATSETPREGTILGGVDTHKDVHTAAAMSETGRLLATAEFPTTPVGYRRLLAWLRSFGPVGRVGIEGTGSYGAGLCRYLRSKDVAVVEANRPNRQWRRRRGKSDPADAEAAARAVLAGEAVGAPKSQDGGVEAIRMLRLARRSAIKARTQAANQLQSVVGTAPVPLREKLRALSIPRLVALARRFRCGAATTPEAAARFTLKSLASRWASLDAEVGRLDEQLSHLVATAAPTLLAVNGVGIEVAGALLVAAGDNPSRLADEASFAALCGVSPVDASSGRRQRHRLNRGGNRDANRALWVIVMVRMAKDSRTRRYVERRTGQGLSKKEIIRCLKRYVAREIYKVLVSVLATDTAPSAAAA